MTDPPDGKRVEPWERFTLLDAFLLQLAFALGLTWGWILWPSHQGPILYLATVLAFGSVLAAPIVFSVQWFLRRRRAPPSVGEQLWIASFVCWLTGYLLVMLMWVAVESSPAEYAVAPLRFYMWPLFLAQTVCSGTAFVWLIRRGWRKRAPVPCKWTDLFGAAACLLLGLWLWFPLITALRDL